MYVPIKPITEFVLKIIFQTFRIIYIQGQSFENFPENTKNISLQNKVQLNGLLKVHNKHMKTKRKYNLKNIS